MTPQDLQSNTWVRVEGRKEVATCEEKRRKKLDMAEFSEDHDDDLAGEIREAGHGDGRAPLDSNVTVVLKIVDLGSQKCCAEALRQGLSEKYRLDSLGKYATASVPRKPQSYPGTVRQPQNTTNRKEPEHTGLRLYLSTQK